MQQHAQRLAVGFALLRMGALLGFELQGGCTGTVRSASTATSGGGSSLVGQTGDASLDGSGAASNSEGGANSSSGAGAQDGGGGPGTGGGDVASMCVVTRTLADGGSCARVCDQLQENGVSEYIEPNPDDGSPLPPGPLSALDAMFAGASTSGGPCIVEPQSGSLFPNNGLRPRIFITPAASGTNYYQIRIHADDQANDLVVYTESRTWEIPKDIWTGLAATTWGEDITVTVSEVSASGGTATSSQATFQIAPANAGGSVVYMAVAGDVNGFSWLEGFGAADEGVSTVLTVPTGPFSSPATNTQWIWSRDSGGNLSTTNRATDTPLMATGDAQCIGCHVVVPDGNSIAFVDFYPWDGVASSINPDAGVAVGQIPPWMTPGGAETLSQGCLGMMSFSTSVWNSGSHLVVAGTQVPENATTNPWASIGGDANPSNLIWIDLSTAAAPTFVDAATGAPLPSISIPYQPFYANQGTTYGYINRSGDMNSASTPAWSHDGTMIAYASNNAPEEGRLGTGSSDLWVVPFDPVAKQAAGSATPLAGAASLGVNEYYPAFSPDDKYVAFASAPEGTPMYYNADAEINVIPSTGGTAVRLAANDPPQCMTTEAGQPVVSPGVTNSWARWSPDYPTCNGVTYYWLIFSSSRLGIPFSSTTSPQNFENGNPDENTSQLYLTAVVDDGSGTLTTYPAIYLWNQPISASASGVTWNQSNQLPEWEMVQIQPPAASPPPPL